MIADESWKINSVLREYYIAPRGVDEKHEAALNEAEARCETKKTIGACPSHGESVFEICEPCFMNMVKVFEERPN